MMAVAIALLGVLALWAIAGAAVMAAIVYARKTVPTIPTGTNEIHIHEAASE